MTIPTPSLPAVSLSQLSPRLSPAGYALARTAIDSYDRTLSRLFPGARSFSSEDIARACREVGSHCPPTNDLRSAVQVYEFYRDRPDRYFAYMADETIGRGRVTTWTGETIGFATLGRPYRDNFGGERVPIRVVATNGRLYHGTYYRSSGDYVRLRACKAQPTSA